MRALADRDVGDHQDRIAEVARRARIDGEGLLQGPGRRRAPRRRQARHPDAIINKPPPLPGYQQIRVAFKATGDFDDDQLAELTLLTSYSPVRDIVSNSVPVAIDIVRA